MTYYSTRRRPDYATRPTGMTTIALLIALDAIGLAAVIGLLAALLMGG